MLRLLTMIAMLFAAPAFAEVKSVGAGGFVLRHEAVLPMTQAAAFKRFAAIDAWWNPAHTYSGEAKALSLSLKPGGCWCEKLKNGFVEHMRVTYLDAPGAVRLSGGLGPLAAMGADGAMDVTFTPEGEGVKAVLTYSVSGYSANGWEKLAPVFDRVLAEQWARFAAPPSKT
jgi:hypothetical protein